MTYPTTVASEKKKKMYKNYIKDLAEGLKKAKIKITISNTNIKMGGIPSFSLPPVATCCNCSECQKDCYAINMCALKKNVLNSWANNLESWRKNPEYVKISIIQTAMISAYFRYFVAGDIPDPEFFQMMIDVAISCKYCKFLAFTKNFDVINDYLNNGGKIPENLKIIFSEWDGQDIQNPHGLPMSAVLKTVDDLPNGGKLCGGSCTDCICRGCGCWELQKGEKIHFLKH